MKIIANKKTLLTSLTRIQGIVERSSIRPITSNALIETNEIGISVSATNLQIGLKAIYSDVEVIEKGRISVNARKLYEIIKELPEKDIHFSEKQNYWLEITCGEDVKFNIIGLPPEDFPMFMKEMEEDFVEWEIEKFINMIELSAFSISRDETKLNICGAFIENLEKNQTRMVTTDGYRLSIIDEILGKKLPLGEGLIIPYKAIIELNKILLEKREEKKFHVLLKQNSLVAKIGEMELFIRLLEKKFPDYKVIIPGEGYEKIEIELEKDKLKPTLRRMSIISQEKNRPVIFSFKNNTLEIFTEDSEFGNVREHLEFNNKLYEEISFCINSHYLLEVLNAIDKDIIIEFNKEEKNKPIIVKTKEKKENIKYIIMPMIID